MQMLWANMTLHASADLPGLMRRWYEHLAIDGFLMCTGLGPATARELRAVYAALGWPLPTIDFIDMHDLGDELVQAGFADPVMDMEVVTLTYDDFDAMLAELRAAGSACAMKARRHGLTGRQAWAGARAGYEGLRCNGRLPATFEIIYGHAWKAAPKQTPDGRAIVRFDLPRKG